MPFRFSIRVLGVCVTTLLCGFAAWPLQAGDLLVAGWSSDNVVRYDALTGEVIEQIVTTRQGNHLSIISGLRELRFLPSPARVWLKAAAGTISVTVCTALASSSLSLVLLAFDPSMRVGLVPIRLATIAMPVGFFVIAARLI